MGLLLNVLVGDDSSRLHRLLVEDEQLALSVNGMQDEGFDPGMTTRQRVAVQTKPANCQICHGMINPLGFSLEHYDAVGRYRAKEKDKPVDAVVVAIVDTVERILAERFEREKEEAR